MLYMCTASCNEWLHWKNLCPY
uniref:Uncharacterized protein n=1 Tax=Anguilla anguilla TaxID=7936 RepID=A0A0E9STP6_ANGAN